MRAKLLQRMQSQGNPERLGQGGEVVRIAGDDQVCAAGCCDHHRCVDQI
jgi:hypothetical protein